MRNIKLTLSYDGTDFFGWQTQPGFRTVQETLETAIAALTGERAHANASGRTDTGVHAVGQVVNFYTTSQHSPDVFIRALNAHLPADVVVREAANVPQAFDARFNWDYDDGRQTMMHLYRKGVEMQWNAETRIDWSQELDEDNPEQLPEEIDPVCGQEVDPEQAHDLGLEVSYAGRRHVFCGQAHRAR